jgi:phosphoenolpyruvate synthase/pyruvate phosphate dikinase
VRRAEAGFGVPVDVEFCFDLRELWLVQCRPITTL